MQDESPLPVPEKTETSFPEQHSNHKEYIAPEKTIHTSWLSQNFWTL